MKIKSIANAIKKGNKIAILGHISPDPDCLGSAFSLKEILVNQLGKNVFVFADGEIRGGDKQIFNNEELNQCEFISSDYDLLIVVDTPNLKRLGKFSKEVQKHKNIVKIDHHTNEEPEFAHKIMIDVSSASTSELIYILLNEFTQKVSKKIATYLYAGISADTNSFLNDNVTPRCMSIASNLFDNGADVLLVNNSHFKSITRSQWDLTKLAYDKAEFYDKFAIIIISQKDIKKLQTSSDGTSAFANNILSVEGVMVSCVITEKNLKTFSCSFRSVYGITVNKIASALGGGGHKQASGAVITGSIKEVKSKVIAQIKKGLKEQGVIND